MKKIIPFLAPIVFLAAIGLYLVYNTTIMVVQTVPNDSLAIGHDKSLKVGDTVTLTGKVVAPAVVNASGNDFRILMRGSSSRTIYIQDTSNALWSGITVRQADTISNTLINNLDSGMKVTLKGIVQEFSLTGTTNTTTQIKLDTLTEIQILPTIKRRPTPVIVNVSDFDSLGKVQHLTGEKYEGMYVQINNVTIGPQSDNTQRHIRSLLDGQGNKIYIRDFSNFFSVSPTPNWGWTAWTPPSAGANVGYIRGVIIEGANINDGTFNGGPAFPYVIVPIYPNDLSLINAPPIIGTVTRSPGVPKPANSVTINAVVTDTLDHSLAVDSCQLFYRVNRGAYNKLHMSPTGNIYTATMPPQTLGTLVEYFVRAKDNFGSIRLNPSDTARSTYFYYVRNSDTMTIKDVQYTPNNGGFSAYNGYSVYTEGIVTCDTTDIPAFQFTNNYGNTQTSPRRVIIQDPTITNGWSGIWISGTPTDLLTKGQRVRVFGQVSESNGMTSINVATAGDLQIVQSGQPLPPFQNLTPGVIANAKIDGDTTIEKWESVLIRFANQTVVSCISAGTTNGCNNNLPIPDAQFLRNFGEIFVVDPNENIEARIELQDGNHSYTNGWDSNRANYYVPNGGGNLLWKWDGISSLQGVLYYAFGKYKMVPRTNADFGTIIGVEPINEIATQFWIKQNYPNPFNPVTNIVYNLPTESEVTLRIYNLVGQEVKTLVSGVQNKGKYEVKFDGMNLASGMYIYVIEANSFNGSSFREVKKMVLVK